MNRKNINFNNEKRKKSDLYKIKKIFNIDIIDANKILVSEKETYSKYNSFKFFIGYHDNGVVRPLYLWLSQITGFINKFKEKKITMSLID